MATLNRRAFLQMAALGAAASAAAGARAAAPAASPVGSDTAREAAPPAQDVAWNEEWEDAIAAARAEGKLSLLTLVGTGYARAVESFEQAFSGITVDRL